MMLQWKRLNKLQSDLDGVLNGSLYERADIVCPFLLT